MAADRADQMDMTSSAVKPLILALASSALIAAPAVAQEPPAAPEVTAAQEAASEAAEIAEEGVSDPCNDPTTSDEREPALPVLAEDDPCTDASAAETGAGASSSAGSASAPKPAPSRQSRRSVLAKGISGGTIMVKDRTKVTQQLLTPTKTGKKTKVLGTATKTARKAGTIRLTIKLNAAGRAFLKTGAKKLTLKTVINPVKGRTKTTKKIITITA